MGEHTPSSGKDGPVFCVICSLELNDTNLHDQCSKREGYIRPIPRSIFEDLTEIGRRALEIRSQEDTARGGS